MLKKSVVSLAIKNNTSIACKLFSQKPKRLHVVKKELMRERSAAEHDPAQAGVGEI